MAFLICLEEHSSQMDGPVCGCQRPEQGLMEMGPVILLAVGAMSQCQGVLPLGEQL